MRTLVIKFGAPRCAPCRTMDPIVKEIAAAHPELEIRDVNADLEPDLAVRYGVRGLPTLTAVRGEEVFDELRGFPGRRKVEEWFERVLGRSR